MSKKEIERLRASLGMLAVCRNFFQNAEERIQSMISGTALPPLAVGGEDEKTDYNAPPNRLFCMVAAWLDYLLGVTTYAEYCTAFETCESIPN